MSQELLLQIYDVIHQTSSCICKCIRITDNKETTLIIKISMWDIKEGDNSDNKDFYVGY